ncbi:hypothetical protein GGS24DRAFT_448587 [Hypoxylon argillaceum]|nr:hypothetical protein GGS24DRAFT_448587 [Hypoxylon argillaceum]
MHIWTGLRQPVCFYLVYSMLTIQFGDAVTFSFSNLATRDEVENCDEVIVETLHISSFPCIRLSVYSALHVFDHNKLVQPTGLG